MDTLATSCLKVLANNVSSAMKVNLKWKPQPSKSGSVFEIPAGLISQTHYQISGNEDYKIGKKTVGKTGVAGVVGGMLGIRQSHIPNAWYGLFNGEHALYPTQCITGYGGRRIGYNEAKALREQGKSSQIRSVSSQHEAIDGITNILDAFGKWGGSFANDPKDINMLNAKLETKWDVNTAQNNVYLIATRIILPHEEIYVYYGRDYWIDSDVVAAKPLVQVPIVKTFMKRFGSGKFKKGATMRKSRNDDGSFDHLSKKLVQNS